MKFCVVQPQLHRVCTVFSTSNDGAVSFNHAAENVQRKTVIADGAIKDLLQMPCDDECILVRCSQGSAVGDGLIIVVGENKSAGIVECCQENIRRWTKWCSSRCSGNYQFRFVDENFSG